jgi:hypothetical protein
MVGLVGSQHRKRDFPRTLTPSFGILIALDQAAVAVLAKLKGSRSVISASSAR